MSTTRNEIIKYALLPRFLPRLYNLFSSGFGQTAFLIAVIYSSLRLLPANHPYLKPENIGQYGIRHVIAAAANNLVFSKKNIDQIIIFFSILVGFVLLFAQFVLLIVAAIAYQPALAQISMSDLLSFPSVSSYAPPGHPEQDMAFVILDRVFGTEGIFNSCVSNTGVPCEDMHGNPLPSSGIYPMPFHTGLHAMLQFYSLGIYLVSVFIIIYFIIVIVGETAETGTPFGQRFNKAWMPVRLMVFFALLTPLNIGTGQNEGLNGAQLIVLWTAKHGSNFATNAWGYFNESLDTAAPGLTYLGDPNELIATPNIPDISMLAQFMFTAKTCQIAEEFAYRHRDDPDPDDNLDGVRAYLVRNDQETPLLPGANYRDLLTTNFIEAMQFVNYGTITVRFGVLDQNNTDYDPYQANVFPSCGDIKIPLVKIDPTITPASGARQMQELYYQIIQNMWNDQDFALYGECILRLSHQPAQTDPDGPYPCSEIPNQSFADQKMQQYEQFVATRLGNIIQEQIDNGNWNVADELRAKGWAGAAIWYNRIAELNGDIANAMINIPTPASYPHVLEFVAKERNAANKKNSTTDFFDPVLAAGENIDFSRKKDKETASAMYAAYKTWEDRDGAKETDNPVIDVINMIFGTSSLFEMRRNVDIHPLAQLSALGKSMMGAAVRNIAIGAPTGMLLKNVTNAPAQLAKAVADFALTAGTMTIAISFVLYYVLPFLPFIYFIFAVSGWIKSIFEAVVAMPIWALAHIIRIDGEGLPGPAATNGYFLILEIFLRPILILFGLLASITIFSTMVEILNDGIFELVVANVSGFDREAEASGLGNLINVARGPVDEFFLTAMYVIIVYMIGLSCFKLIDLIPNNMLRWAGVTIKTFQEDAGDPAGQLLEKTYKGGLLFSGQFKGREGALAALSG